MTMGICLFSGNQQCADICLRLSIIYLALAPIGRSRHEIDYVIRHLPGEILTTHLLSDGINKKIAEGSEDIALRVELGAPVRVIDSVVAARE